MILENSKLLKEQLGNTLIFVYPLNFNDVEKYATIEIEGIVKVYSVVSNGSYKWTTWVKR